MKQNESEEQLQSTRIGSVPKKSSVLGLGCWAGGGVIGVYRTENDSLDAIKASYTEVLPTSILLRLTVKGILKSF